MPHPAGLFALRHAKPFDRLASMGYYERWQQKQLFVDKNGSAVARPGAVIKNGPHFDLIFKDGRPVETPHVAMILLTGPTRGKLFFESIADVADRWLYVEQERAPGVYLLVDPPREIDLGIITLDSLMGAYSSGFEFAERARQNAHLGDLTTARGFLNSARKEVERADKYLRILYSFGIVSDAEAEALAGPDVGVALQLDIANAEKAIFDNDSGMLLHWTNKILEVAKRVAVQGASIGDARLRQVIELYGALVRRNQAERTLVDALSADDPLKKTLDVLLKKTVLVQERFELQLKSFGLDIGEVRKSAGLSGLPAILIALGAKYLTLQTALSIVRFVVIQIVLGVLLEAISSAIQSKLLEVARLQELATRLEIALETSKAEAIVARTRTLLESVQAELDILKKAATLGHSDPAITGRIDYLSVQQTRVAAGEKMESPEEAARQMKPRERFPLVAVLVAVVIGGLVAWKAGLLKGRP